RAYLRRSWERFSIRFSRQSVLVGEADLASRSASPLLRNTAGQSKYNQRRELERPFTFFCRQLRNPSPLKRSQNQSQLQLAPKCWTGGPFLLSMTKRAFARLCRTAFRRAG